MVTLVQLKKICPLSPRTRLAPLIAPMCAAMEEFEINTYMRVTAFIAQLAHESGGFQFFAEIASGNAYNGKTGLGNDTPGALRIAAAHGSTPGPWWKGHGPIQITGYYNHLHCGNDLGLDLMNNPRLLELPEHGFRGAGWFWEVKKLNFWADQGNFIRLTKMINGGTNGLEDRKAYYERAKAVLTP